MVSFGKSTLSIMAAGLLLPLYLFGQGKIFTEDFNINLKTSAVTGLPEKILSAYAENVIYTATPDAAMDKDFLTIFTFNIVSKTRGEIKIKKKKNNQVFGQSLLSIGVAGEKLFLLTSSEIHILKKMDKGEWMRYKTIQNIPTFNRIFNLNKDYVLFYVNYNFHPSDELYKHSWAKYNLRSDSLGPEIHLEENNARFSYFTNDWLSTYKGLIAYARTTEYKVSFYDDVMELVDSIVSDKFSANSSVLRYVPKGTAYSSDEMKKIAMADDTLLNRIEKIFLLDSNNLLVTIKQPNSKVYGFDLWNKNSGKWAIKKSQLVESMYIEKKTYTNDNNQISGFFGNHAGVTYDGNGHFYVCYFPFRNNIVSESFNRQRDFIDPLNDLVRKNELYFGMRKIDITK